MAHGKSLREMENAITDITKLLEQKQAVSIDEIQRMKKHLESLSKHNDMGSTWKKLHYTRNFFKKFLPSQKISP